MSQIKSFEMEDIAYKEWSQHLDMVSSSRAGPWLPAYGHHAPAPIQEIYNDPFSSDGSALLSQPPHFLYLETIVEETADDLCSELDRSGPQGWNSDSDADSVIHVPKVSYNRDLRAEWRPSEFDADIPRKRRRRFYDRPSLSDDDEPVETQEWVDNSSLSSRSSSLLAFESLEKHCEDIFKTTASSDPFGAGAGHKEEWLSSEDDSSDDTLHHSMSSHSSFRSSLTNDSRIRSYRSFDSLNLFDTSSPLPYTIAELSQSHSALDYEKEKERKQEELVVRDKKLTATTADLTVVTDSFEYLNMPFRKSRDLTSYHTKVRRERKCDKVYSYSAEGLKTSPRIAKETACIPGHHGKSDPCLSVPTKPQHSVENLSEDSGFGDFSKPCGKNQAHLSSVSSILEDGDSSSPSNSSYYSDCGGSEEDRSTEITEEARVSVVRGSAECDDPVIYNLSGDVLMVKCAWQTKGEPVASSPQTQLSTFGTFGKPARPYSHDDLISDKCSSYFGDKLSVFSETYESPLDSEDFSFSRQQMAGRLPVVSTPNLYAGDDEYYKNVPSAASSLTHVPLKSLDDEEDDLRWRSLSGSQKVHFCPVVSEVSWRESYSEDSSDTESSDPSTDEMSNRSLEDLCVNDEDEEEEEEEEDEEEDDDEGEEEYGADVKTLPATEFPCVQKVTEFDGDRILVEMRRDDSPGRSDCCSRTAAAPVCTLHGNVNINTPSHGNKPYVEERFPPTTRATPTRSDHVVATGAAQPNAGTTNVAVPVLSRQSVDDARSAPVDCIAFDTTRGATLHSSLSSLPTMASFTKPRAKGKFGGFFERFSFRRLSGRTASSGKKQKHEEKVGGVSVGVCALPAPCNTDVRIIPLHGPDEEVAPRNVTLGKPPLPPQPPRVHSTIRKRGGSTESPQDGVDSAMPGASGGDGNVSRQGLLETDLDTVLSECSVRRPVCQLGQNPTLVLTNGAAGNKKARSLMDLGLGEMSLQTHKPPSGPRLLQVASPTHSVAVDDRAKSMEFLLDKENQAAVQPPENELQKGGVGDRVLSEHQMRVQRSLQKLNIPDWYKNSAVAQTPQGFLLKRHEGGSGWPGLGSKTTSLSSLGSTQSASARSPTSHVLSPSPTPHFFTRWSTSRLNSGATSTSTSPCGSARSSFNYRQPYLGWRSQERLTRPRTPHERLSAGLLPQQKQQLQLFHSQNQAPPTPNLSDVRTSIKEVTSAIVHYVSGVQDKGSREGLSRGYYAGASPSHSQADSGSTRGSAGRLCWLESSFVGSRPLDQPETPQPAQPTAQPQLFLELNSKAQPMRNEHIPMFEEAFEIRNKPNPSSTTLDDVLESLLGLPPTSRSPSPSGASLSLPERPHTQRHSCGDIRTDLPGSASDVPREAVSTRRKSDGSTELAPKLQAAGEAKSRRREAEDEATKRPELVEPVVKCRYSKCGKTATVLDAKRTFKTCHNCAHVYCSRECRRAHWERHRRTCLHSRVGALCRQVLAAAKEDSQTLHQLSMLARRGYLTHGRGAVKSFFSSPELAEKFVQRGFSELGEPAYVRWSDLLPTEMGADLYTELMKLCKSYNPDSRFVLYVAVCVVSEVPTTGAVKWERQLVSRCCKVRLDKALVPPKQSGSSGSAAPPLPPRRSSSESVNITRDMENPETLILTSLPGIHGQVAEQRVREISFTNIQRQLRQRGVSLRRQFPDVYKKLCAYVEGTSERFMPVTIYPRDSASGKSFMCIIMPDTEPEKLQFVPKDSSRVHTVDVSIATENTETI